MTYRAIEKILTPKDFIWVGDAFYTTSYVGNEIPRRRMDPFFAVGYNADIEFESSVTPRGVGAHPHKGFETVTLAYKGKIEHRDSRGNHGIIQEGDVQWMTTGSGILHEEYHEEGFSKQGGLFQMVQLWVNLPAKDKETTPKYQEQAFETMTKVWLDDNGSFINVITGEYNGQHGKTTTFSPIHLYNAYLKNGSQAKLNFPKDFNTALLVIEGSIKINGTNTVNKDAFVLMENSDNTEFEITSMDDNTVILIMSGAPLNEPIAHYGPFVMNTQEQIIKAIEEFQSGKFGVL